jgi:putative membrane protein
LVFALAALLVAVPAVRRMATPQFLKSRRVKRSAYAHFASTGLAGDPGRTGVLIFASLRDRQAELVADEMIHQAVGEAHWREAMSALVSGLGRKDPAGGFVRAIEICSGALEAHAPKGPPRGPHGDGVLEI